MEYILNTLNDENHEDINCPCCRRIMWTIREYKEEEKKDVRSIERRVLERYDIIFFDHDDRERIYADAERLWASMDEIRQLTHNRMDYERERNLQQIMLDRLRSDLCLLQGKTPKLRQLSECLYQRGMERCRIHWKGYDMACNDWTCDHDEIEDPACPLIWFENVIRRAIALEWERQHNAEGNFSPSTPFLNLETGEVVLIDKKALGILPVIGR